MSRVARCSFCGKDSCTVSLLVASSVSRSYICNECVSLSTKIAQQQRDGIPEGTLTPPTIYSDLNKYIVGQEYAKKVTSVSAYNHLKRIKYIDSCSDVEIEKSNILVLGPTGTGKTLLASTLAKILDVPIVVVDATTYTEAGYVGEDVENSVYRLLQKANNNVRKAERGIICIDEVDKTARKTEGHSMARDVSGEGVQQSLLKLLEGSTLYISPSGSNRKPSTNETIKIDTRNILFICCGAFSGLEDIIAKRMHGTSIGFGAEVRHKNELRTHNLLEHTTHEDLIEYGMIPEFVSRLPVLAPMRSLDEEMLVRILTEPKNALLKQYARLFEMDDDVRLTFTDDAVLSIAKLATQRASGARGLRSILESILLDYMFEVPINKSIRTLEITKEMVEQQCGKADIANTKETTSQ